MQIKHGFVCLRDIESLRHFLNDLFSAVEQHDICVEKIYVKHKKDLKLVRDLAYDICFHNKKSGKKENSCVWGVEYKDIKLKPRMPYEFMVEANDDYAYDAGSRCQGNVVVVSKLDKDRYDAQTKKVDNLRIQLQLAERELRKLESQLLVEYTGAEPTYQELK